MKLDMLNTKQPVIYVLVGAPGSGKSTYVNSMLSLNENFVIISTDNEIEIMASDQNKTYSEVFKVSYKAANAIALNKFNSAINTMKNIIWDQTNMTAKKRRSILDKIPSGYKKIAVVFELDRQELNRRLNIRAKESGKFIPANIVDNMLANFEYPSLDEGFDEILKK